MPRNYYRLERIQKKLPKQEDEQYQYTGMRINKHFLLVGGTGTGKTNGLYDYVVQTSQPPKGTFKHIYVCYKTDETLYEDMKEELGKGISFFKSVSEFPSVDEFPDSSVNDYKDKYLIVFDDCINDKDKNSYDKIRKYFTYGRKKGITIAYLAQSFYSADSFIRKQMSYLLLLSIKGKRDLNNILGDFGGLSIDKETLYKIFKTATKPDDENEFPLLKINCEKCKSSEQFSRDWLEYIQYKNDSDDDDEE